APDIYQPMPQPQIEPESPTLPQTETSIEVAPLEQLATLATETQESPSPAVPPISPRLLISHPNIGEPYEFLLEHHELTLGHAGSDHILLNQDTSTSRHHALLKHEDDHYTICDQRSTNGTYVNGQKLAEDTAYILLDGDHISIGNYQLIFHYSKHKTHSTTTTEHLAVTYD